MEFKQGHTGGQMSKVLRSWVLQANEGEHRDLLAEVAHLQQNNLVSTEWHCDQWEIFFGLPSGPLLTVLNEHTWQHMD